MGSLSELLKVITAVVSWLTVAALIKIIPQALTLPGLARVNRLCVPSMGTVQMGFKSPV